MKADGNRRKSAPRTMVKRKIEKAKKRFLVAEKKMTTAAFLQKANLDVIGTADTIYLLTDGLVKLTDIIGYYIGKSSTPSKLYIATLSFDSRAIETILKWFDSGLLNFIRMIRCDLYLSRRAGFYEYTRQELEKRGQKVIGDRSHAKVFLIQTDKEKITISGSMNLTSGDLYENITIARDPRVFDFYRQWFDITFGEGPNG